MSNYTQYKVWGEITYSKLKWGNCWNFGLDEYFHPTLNWECNHSEIARKTRSHIIVSWRCCNDWQNWNSSIQHTEDWRHMYALLHWATIHSFKDLSEMWIGIQWFPLKNNFRKMSTTVYVGCIYLSLPLMPDCGTHFLIYCYHFQWAAA